MTPITKAAQDAIEAFDAMTKGNERDSDGAWGRIVMPSNAALEKADKAAEALRAALQDKADTEDHLFEAFGDGPTDDQCADLWRRYPSLRDWHKRTFGALQDKAGEVRGDGWLQDGGLLYRLTDDVRVPENRDEINVTMADGSRSPESRARRAGELLDRIRAAKPAPVVPDGFALVPVEPTQAMIVAAQCAYWPGMEVPNVHCITRALKAAMLAASQQKGGQHG